MLTYKDLISVCQEAIDTFKQEDESVEEHIKVFLKKKKGLDDDDHTFLVEVFSGYVHNQKLINVVVQGFYLLDGKCCLRSDQHLYSIICYLLLFRLSELGIAHFKKFIKSQDANKMYKFLNFFLSEGNLDTWIYSDWCKVYDSKYIQEEVMMPLLRYKSDLDDFVSHLYNIVEHRIPHKSMKKKSTEIKPFNITQPKPRGIPFPERIPELKKHKPVPTYIYKQPKEEEKIKNLKEDNRKKAEEFLLSINENKFNCANPEKSIKTRNIIKNIANEEQAKHEFNKKHARPVPKHITQNRPIKLNAAAILREGSLFRKKETQELQKLENLLQGAKDATEFLVWQKKMKDGDHQEKMAEIERKRVEGKISHEEAIIAQQRQTELNQIKVNEIKQETEELMHERLQIQLAEEEQMKALVQEIIEGHENTKIAKQKLADYKRKIVQEVNAESQELMRQALEKAEEDMRRKTELIQEIRAMESIPINRYKLVDLSETAGHSLLSEMSIVELKERLCFLKEENQKQEEEKRDEIIREKQQKNDMLMETLAKISVHRNEISKAAEMKTKEQKERDEERIRKLKQDRNLIALQEKLAEKKKQRIAHAEKTVVKPSSASYRKLKDLGRVKEQQEKTRWLQLELSQQRLAKMRAQSGKVQQDSLQQKSAIIT